MSRPQYFEDDLKARAAPVAFQRIGNPYHFLTSIGLQAVLERIYKGANIVDVAQELNVSVTVLRFWLEETGGMREVAEAERLSADGYLSVGQRLLAEARSDFDLKKAKEMLNHSRWLASNLDKGKYSSNREAQLAPPGGITYIFNIGDQALTQETKPDPRDADAIEGEYAHLDNVPPVTLDPIEFEGPEPDTGPFVSPITSPSNGDPVPEHLKALYDAD